MAWQCRLACGEGAAPDRPDSLRTGVECRSRLIDIPTGCGKTAGLVLAWLWNRIVQNGPTWSRRLIYCLPMRALVEQTRDNVIAWLANIHARGEQLGLTDDARAAVECLFQRSPIVLMGGEEQTTSIADWDLYPEQPAIFIGTQDMLLSRALNRGYAMSRYRWPRHFGLLNNDCLWVCDEIQLMGPGVATASQLEAFRRDIEGARPHGFASFFGSRSATWYASATSSPDLLNTREWRDVPRLDEFVFPLADAEKAGTQSVVGRRRYALKRLETHRDWHFGDKQPPNEIVGAIIGRHREMVSTLHQHSAPADAPRRSLVICNTVDRAVAVFEALWNRREASAALNETDLVLLHSRFRPKDRRDQMNRLKPPHARAYANGQIVVSTQVIEAGVDLSSPILWTEAAPLSSLVQRLGRLNRAGEFGANGNADHGWTPMAFVVGLELPEIPPSPQKKKDDAEREVRARHLPYDQRFCDNAWNTLPQLNGDASPAVLESIRDAIAASIDRSPYSLQRHELLDFFDTDSNLSFGYTDVSPFVRGLDEDTDVYVLWREWEGKDPNESFGGEVGRDELCAVPINRLRGDRGFANWRQGWLWLGNRRGKQGGWVSAEGMSIAPGATLLLPTSAGGYAAQCGWTGRVEDKPDDLFQPAERPSDEDQLSWLNHGWRSIAEHGRDVCDELRKILSAFPSEGFISAAEKDVCLKAAVWHDVGKNHKKWKTAALDALREAAIEVPSEHLPLAKFSLSDSPRLRDGDGNPLTGNKWRREIYRLRSLFHPGMAHEVASALALRQRHIQCAGNLRSVETKNEYLAQLLAEYLVMSHHGQVRKVLRDEIPRNASEQKDEDTVRGVTEGDTLEGVTIDGEVLGCEALSVDCRRMGRDKKGYESYTRGVLRLLDHYGPFRLAFLEALIRAADGRASRDLARSPTDPKNNI